MYLSTPSTVSNYCKNSHLNESKDKHAFNKRLPPVGPSIISSNLNRYNNNVDNKGLMMTEF